MIALAARAAAVGARGARAGVDRASRGAGASDLVRSLLDTRAACSRLLSFLAIGGVNALIPEIHRRVVDMQHWLTDADFAQAFAIAQAAPGPNMLIVSVHRLAGGRLSRRTGRDGGDLRALVGAHVCVAHVWDRFRDAPLRRAIQQASRR